MRAMRALLRSFALSVAFVVLAATGADVSAQVVQGQVTVENSPNEPIEGAFVVLVDGAGGSAAAAFTTETGHFLLDAREEGTYRIRVDRIGFESWTSEEFILTAGEPRSVQIWEYASPDCFGRVGRMNRLRINQRRQAGMSITRGSNRN